MSDRTYVITISSGVDDGVSDISVETWKVDEAKAMGYRRALTEAHGEPITGIIAGAVINGIDEGPGVVLLSEGDQVNMRAAPPPHYNVTPDDQPEGEIVCNCGVTFDGIDPEGDLERHMEAENP